MQHRAKKQLGQNFLVDNAIIQRIVDSIAPEHGQLLIEIGPGLGALTQRVAPMVDSLHVIEYDHDIIPKLLDNVEQRSRLIVHENDVLDFDFRSILDQASGREKLRIFGNLPYNISTPLLFHLLGYRSIIEDMHFMLQKEVVDRLSATIDSKAYGRLTVMLGTWFDIVPLFIVPPGAFRPAPKVDSAVIRMVPKTDPSLDLVDFDLLERIVRAAFSQRRKTLRNTLSSICDERTLKAADIDPGLRAENIPVDAYLRLHELIRKDVP